jgi:hypothetical protein
MNDDKSPQSSIKIQTWRDIEVMEDKKMVEWTLRPEYALMPMPSSEEEEEGGSFRLIAFQYFPFLFQRVLLVSCLSLL